MISARSGRVLVEGIVIVASILLAFGIEAAWASRGEQRGLEQLRVSLHADVVATRAAIDERERWAETVAMDARAILGAIARGESGTALDSVVFTLGNVFSSLRIRPPWSNGVTSPIS